MKKLRSSQILVLVLLLGALLLTGCGKKNSPPVDPVDPNAPKIHFVMPGTYVDEEDQERDIPAGRTVKFYTVEYFDDEEESATYDADKHVFTGTTKAGGGKITCALPDSMLGKERYIFAIVVLEGDYDLNGKTMNEMYEAVVTKKILYSDISEDGYKLFTLTDGITIEGFDFVGVFGDPPIEDPDDPDDPEEPGEEITVIFDLPAVYYDLNDNTLQTTVNMPLDKPIDFYITEIEGEQGDPIDEEALVINAHIPPDELSVTCNLPEGLNNERLKIHALVHLEPNDLNLRGMTFDEIEPELKAGIALYGSSDGTQLILDGESITKFKFYGYTQ